MFGLTKVERRAAKEIALNRAASSVLAARGVAAVEAIEEVGEAALMSGAVLTDLECLLVARNPAFAGRAAYINGRNCMSLGRAVDKMARSL
ncbi:MAG TPA: hypothetical protein VIC06_03090 [Solirubrobacteraceae bacterium]